MRTRVLLAGLSLLVIGLAWWTADNGRTRADEAVAPGDPTATSEPPAPTLRAAPGASQPGGDGSDASTDDAVIEEEIIEEDDLGIDPKDAPPDPPATGECTLELFLSRKHAGGPLPDGRVGLWRIDEPGNEHWRRGDREQAEATTQDGRATWRGLAPGRYRIHAHEQRKGSEDPPAFDVAGAETVVHMAVPEARRVPVRVKVFDEHASILTRGWKMFAGGSMYSSSARRPDWVTRRRLKRGFLRPGGVAGGTTSGSARGDGSRTDIEGDLDGLLLGEFAEPTRYTSWSSSWDVGFDGMSTVRVWIDIEEPRPHTVVAAVMPMDRIEAMFLLPDGRRAVDAGAEIKAWCKAVPVPVGGPERPWDRLTIVATAKLDGYEERRVDLLSQTGL